MEIIRKLRARSIEECSRGKQIKCWWFGCYPTQLSKAHTKIESETKAKVNFIKPVLNARWNCFCSCGQMFVWFSIFFRVQLDGTCHYYRHKAKNATIDYYVVVRSCLASAKISMRSFFLLLKSFLLILWNSLEQAKRFVENKHFFCFATTADRYDSEKRQFQPGLWRWKIKILRRAPC